MIGQDKAGDPPAAGDWVVATYGRRARDALVDLAEFGGMAARLVARGRDAYDQDETLRLAAEAVASRMGEAVARLSEEFIKDHPRIPWRKIRGMRNIISHDYGRVDHDLLWNALVDRVPEVATLVDEVLMR